jgi:hypothetical protein
MIDFNLTEQPNSIEELFAKQFEQSTKYPMDNETSEIFVKLILSKNSQFEIPDNEKPFLYQLIEKRISVVHDYKVDDRVLLFLSWICKSAGEAVMYCWFLQQESKKRNVELITFEIFSNIFGSGFPSSEGLHKIWLAQKINCNSMFSSDNLLDYPKAGFSLFKKTK